MTPCFIIRRQIEPAILFCHCRHASRCRYGRPLGTSSFLAAVFFMPLPFVLWAAVRYGEKGASAGILVVTVIPTWLTPLLRSVPGENPGSKRAACTF